MRRSTQGTGGGRGPRSPPAPWARSSPAVSPPYVLAILAPTLSAVALEFGAPEYFSLMALGLVAAAVLAHGSLIKAIAMVVMGLLFGLVGTDVSSRAGTAVAASPHATRAAMDCGARCTSGSRASCAMTSASAARAGRSAAGAAARPASG